MGADFLHQAMAAGLICYAEGADQLIDLVMDPPRPCRGCGQALFSRWMHPEDNGLRIEIWSAIALGFEEVPGDAWIAEPGWLCECCRITFDQL